jgi:hypothetical protein
MPVFTGTFAFSAQGDAGQTTTVTDGVISAKDVIYVDRTCSKE